MKHKIFFGALFISVLLLSVPQIDSEIYFTGNNHHKELTQQTTDTSWSVRMANSFLIRHPQFISYDSTHKWDYEQGFMLYGIFIKPPTTKNILTI
jgi:hypothetical protein